MNIIYLQDQEIRKYKGEFYHPKSEQFFVRYLAGMTLEDTLTVYAGIREISDENLVKRYKKISHPRITFKEVPLFRKLKNLPRIFSLVKEIIKSADFCYLRCGISSSIAGYFCLKNHIPYMAIVNEDVYKNTCSHSRFLVRMSAIPLGLMTKRMVRNANFACYVTRDYLESHYPCKGKILGCSDIEFLEINDTSLEERVKKISAINGKIVLGSVGAVSTRIKGHDTVVRALALLKNEGYENYRYQLVGTGDQTIIRSLAEELGIADMIEFLGEFSHTDVLKWFETVDIYLHPSRSEGLPRTILEAMTKATPCICSSVGGIPELVDKAYLFDYNGTEVECLKNLIKSFSAEKMKDQAQVNYKRSKLYEPHLLEQKRSAFFSEALNEIRKL